MKNEKSTVIYEWNKHKKREPIIKDKLYFLDETLRDGLQSPSIIDPNINDKIKLIHIMDDLGIEFADIGMPGISQKIYLDVIDIVNEIDRANLKIKPCCAARTKRADIEPIIDIAEKTGTSIEVLTFVGSSPIRLYVEGWDISELKKRVKDSIKICHDNGLPVTFVTEDTTRSDPNTLYELYKTALDEGVKRVCISDTVGYITPDGVKNIMDFFHNRVLKGYEGVEIDWHGHNDRGLGLTNSLYAIEFGATRVHGTALGIGERVGNAAMELILMNLKLLGEIDNDLSKLFLYCKVAAESTRFKIPSNYPLVGEDAFRTATGIHASAILKAKEKGDFFLADRVYSGIPAGMFGHEQIIEIGPNSGKANIKFWLLKRNIPFDEKLVNYIFDRVKTTTRILQDEEIYEIISDYNKNNN